jgi:hypothetical protein
MFWPPDGPTHLRPRGLSSLESWSTGKMAAAVNRRIARL